MIWAEAIHPGVVENKPLGICLRQSDDRRRPGTKPSDMLEVAFTSKWPRCHQRFIVPRACKEAWAVNLLIYPHCAKGYPRDEQAYLREGKLEIDSQHPDAPRAFRFNGARDRFVVVLPYRIGSTFYVAETITVMNSDVFKDTRELSFDATAIRQDLFYEGWNIARLLPFFPSLRRVVWGFHQKPIRRGPRPVNRPVAEDLRFHLERIGEEIEFSKGCGYRFGRAPAMPETGNFHTNQLVPLAQAIKAGWYDWRDSLGQKGAAPELVQNGDRFVRRCTVACRQCEWKHEEHKDGKEQDVFDLMEEERRQLEAQENTERGNK
ncbi:hypothetical protein V8F33_011085 [Rhypophila sp. PSN 637]